ncbi:unnamed protein product [Clonostachys rosea f. rosea IK726]|uniref:Uncharacterized protein n=2 Tax=Bionectria ochroleuca TaxID=29856 RepID=A0A0B7JQQ3_BIOOC|nr:unnamed protein product [Clonostachys rosea f. rosea IK726]
MPLIDENHASSYSWFFSLFMCCSPLTSCLARKSRRSKSPSLTTTEKSWPVGRYTDQDLLINKDAEEKGRQTVIYTSAVQISPSILPLPSDSLGLDEKDMAPRKSFASTRKDSRLKKIFRPANPNKRPKISAPSDFRHIETGSFAFPPVETPPPQPRLDGLRQHSPHLRPLELSIYMPNNRISPILPHFEFPPVKTPERAVLEERLTDDHQLVRQRSYTSVPFHIPRKPAIEDLSFSQACPPDIPPKSQARPRANTSPEIEAIKARVANAMLEVEELQRQIEEAAERQSLYALSRPSTSQSRAELEPMPSIPALPPAAPSFAERLNSGVQLERPRTAPLNHMFPAPISSERLGESLADLEAKLQLQQTPTLAPPLPLVLRPPLRKKKSFSRVSTWLFPHGQHKRDVSLDSVTNVPRPIKGTDGFYQCVQPGGSAQRTSFDSLDTVSTWDSEDDQRTAPTNWSPESTPAAKMEGVPMERQLTFGKRGCSSP